MQQITISKSTVRTKQMLSEYPPHPILRTQRKPDFAAPGKAKQAANSGKEEANPRTVCASPSTALPALFPHKITQFKDFSRSHLL